MKAIGIHSYGDSDQLKIKDNDDKVLVQIHATGVNPMDWKIRGGYAKDWMPMSFPLIMGQDLSGEC